MTLIFLKLCIERCPLWHECNEATEERKCQGVGQSKFLEQIHDKPLMVLLAMKK